MNAIQVCHKNKVSSTYILLNFLPKSLNYYPPLPPPHPKKKNWRGEGIEKGEKIMQEISMTFQFFPVPWSIIIKEAVIKIHMYPTQAFPQDEIPGWNAEDEYD